jgi:hypothetical protein
MGRVLASVKIAAMTSDAEALWYDQSRWPAFIDGFAHVTKQEGQWPQAGTRLTWSSVPGGRGTVMEDVVHDEPRVGQELTVEDERMRGRQRIGFHPTSDGVRVTLEVDYEIKGDKPLKPLFDIFFVQRPMRESVNRTLTRFRRELLTDQELARDQGS